MKHISAAYVTAFLSDTLSMYSFSTDSMQVFYFIYAHNYLEFRCVLIVTEVKKAQAVNRIILLPTVTQ